MKKVFLGLVAVLAASICSAGFSFCIGSEGEDRYADGTRVLPGEHYGLVRVPTGKSFDGIRSDGSLVNPETNQLFPIAVTADGKFRLPICSYTMDESLTGATFYLVLFDTRTPDGSVNGPIVNGWAVVASVNLPKSSTGSGTASASRIEKSVYATAENGSTSDKFHAASLTDSVPAGAIIEKMDFVGDEVWLTVRNTGSDAYYAAAGAENLSGSDFETQGTKTAVRGAADADDTIIVKFPKSDKNAHFFKVKGGTLMNL